MADGAAAGRAPRPGDGPTRQRLARARARRRRRRVATVALLVASAVIALVGLARGWPVGSGGVAGVAAAGADREGAAAATVGDPDAAGAASGSPAAEADADYPTTGSGTFGYAGGGRTLGSGGELWRYRVAVERGMGQDVDGFAAEVDAILGDPRGWTAAERVRFQRVGRTAAARFTIFLATPGTSERMCAEAGLHTERYGSCHTPGKVILNVARWLTAVPDYGAPIEVYRAYALNHEVGHELGEGHQACPRPGAPAPVMQQQTYGLRGCAPNGWPYVDGRRYTGPAIP
ncbi:DUF3152 domain-containing protein [Micromonospora sp. HM5-17]|nr:DUF3152 domain-containing protein [Micromonospora sp. HM5-17]